MRDLKGVFTKVQKRWLISLTREAKGGKSQKKVAKVEWRKEGARGGEEEGGRSLTLST